MRPYILSVLLSIFGVQGEAMADTNSKTAIFAGGCFWCMEPEFAAIDGVSKVVSGYTGGKTANPTYEQVSSGETGHVEAIEVTYDPSRVSYTTLLDVFWRNIDPLDQYGQFCDKGSQYRAGIYYSNDEEKQLANASKDKVQAMFKQPVATAISKASVFWPAEDYHQQFYIKSKIRYKTYRFGCGRDERLENLWKDKPAVAK